MKSREVYRVQAEEGRGLQVVVETAPGEAFEAQVVDVSIKGAATRFPARAPTLSIGDRVWLVFHAAALPEEVAVAATVRHFVQEEHGLRYGFEFHARGRLGERIPTTLQRLFNRRAAYRAAPREPSEVALKTSAEVRINARLRDLSATGIGVLVDPEVAPRFVLGERVDVSFELPHRVGRFDLAAWVRNYQRCTTGGFRTAWSPAFAKSAALNVLSCSSRLRI